MDGASANPSSPSGSTATAAYELVQASQALQAVQALSGLDSGGGGHQDLDIEPLAQDPTLLTAMDPTQLAQAMSNCTMLDMNTQVSCAKIYQDQ